MQSIIFQKLDVFGHPLAKRDASVVQFLEATTSSSHFGWSHTGGATVYQT